MNVIFITGFALNHQSIQPLANAMGISHPIVLNPHRKLPGLYKDTVVIGHSLGGQVAYQWAEAESNIVGVVTLASSPCLMEKPDWPGLSQEAFNQLLEQVKHSPVSALKSFHRWQLSGATDRQNVLKTIFTDGFSTDALLAMLSMIEQNDFRPVPPSCEHLSILAKDDVIVPWEAVSTVWPSMLLDTGSHSFLVEQAEQIAPRIMEFANECFATAAL